MWSQTFMNPAVTIRRQLSVLTTYLYAYVFFPHCVGMAPYCFCVSVQFPENSKPESFTFHLLFCIPLKDLPVYVLPHPWTTSILSPALLSHRQVPPTSAPCPLGNGDIIKPMEAGCTPPQSLMTHYPVLTHRLTSLPCIQTHSYAHIYPHAYLQIQRRLHTYEELFEMHWRLAGSWVAVHGQDFCIPSV